MKLLFVAIVILGIFALCQAEPFCCTAPQWSGLNANWDPQMTYFAFGNQAYDYTNSQEYFNAIEMDGNNRINVTYILNWASGKGYRVYTSFGGDKCRIFPLNGPMIEYCIPNQAVFKGNFTIGQSLAANAWEFIQGDIQGFIQVAAVGCVPIRTQGNSFNRNPNVDQENYFNLVNTVNPAIFAPPTYCGI